MALLDSIKEKEILDASITFKISTTRKRELLKLCKKEGVSSGALIRLAIGRMEEELGLEHAKGRDENG